MKYGPHDTGAQQGSSRKRHNHDIRQEGDSIIIPKTLDVSQTISALQQKLQEEENERCIMETIHVSPPEGALALSKALKSMFGVALEGRGSDITLETGVGQTTVVRWGRYDLPMGGYVEASTDDEDGRTVFRLHAHVKGKFEHTVRNLILKVRELAANDSPYRGKAFKIVLTEDGDRRNMPVIKFLDLPKDPVPVIVRPGIERDFKTCIWGPIENTAVVRKMGTPLSRKVLLAGEYGTGKTLTALRTAQICSEHAWTFIYLEDSTELPIALDFARQYEPCVLFVEDIDRIAGLERTDEVNDVVNALDGIASKTSEIMVVYTTNHPRDINSAMRRPGRIDTAINILPPDGPTAARLLAHYTGTYLGIGQDLSAVGEKLANVIPAQIREVAERAKLAAGASGMHPVSVTAEDLDYAAGSVQRERELFAGQPDEHGHKLSRFARDLGHALIESAGSNGNGTNGRSHVEESLSRS